MFMNTLPNILFLDIETVSEYPDYQGMDENSQLLWQHKSAYWLKDIEKPKEADYAKTYRDKAGIYAEFAKVVCISMGLIVLEKGEIHSFRLNSICSDDEEQVLKDFAHLLDKFYPSPQKYFLCGHNIREFDVPFLSRRMIIKGIRLPAMLDISGKKPWESKFLLDTLEMWKFGDYKNYTSLKLLAHVLGIPSPKDDIDGSQVGKVYWQEKDLERIRVYCEKDVVTCAQVFLRLNALDPIGENQIIYTD
jgi:DNA polymerase elongation subunit (family B)